MDFDTAMAMIDGRDTTEYKLSVVSDADRARIDNGLEMVFAGLTLQKWLCGGTLGDAWHAALDEMRPIGFDVVGDSPILIYLRHANFQHRRRWDDKFRESKNYGDFINCPPDKVEQWRARGVAQVNDGMKLIQQTLASFVPIERTDKNMPRHMQYENQHTREYEHVHERKK